MRILSGKWGNRKIIFEKNAATHPMGEREKNAIFNMVGEVSGLFVLDWFAGSGQLGLECLSRGALKTVFVEKDKKNRANIKRNLAEFGGEAEMAEIVPTITDIVVPSDGFDLIFADPPYDKFFEFDFSEVSDMLKEEGLFVLSSPGNEKIPGVPGTALIKSKTYAGARITIYRKYDII
ncbi:RsmD family RNA methyltransferase [Candidatus Saccharibacteria bacterium]|nr:RsmD family RNA methyltransferase [Candidatus Saccharibacteria bacterium]